MKISVIIDAISKERTILATNLSNKQIKNLWRGILQRCYNPLNREYRYYGKRGITLHDAWQIFDLFKLAIEELGPRPEGWSIDRIDNDKGYTPGNIRWASPSMQARNSRRKHLVFTQKVKPKIRPAWMGTGTRHMLFEPK